MFQCKRPAIAPATNALSPPTSESNRATPSTLSICRVAFTTPAAMPDRDFSARSRPSGKKLAGPLARGSADPAAISSPPEGFLDFQSDVAPGQPDIVQVAVGPLRQFAALPNPGAPNVQGVADLLEKTPAKMICHRTCVKMDIFGSYLTSSVPS